MNARLVTVDLDGTLLPRATVFATVLRENGHAALADEVDGAVRDGRIDDAAAFRAQWQVVRTLTPADIHRALRKADWLPGIADGVRELRAAGLGVRLLTDQPTVATDFLGRFGLTDAIASPTTVKEGRIAALDERLDKWANLQAALAQATLAPSEVVHVGNGPNDVPVWQRVGGSVAVFAPPAVARHAKLDLGAPASFVEVARAVLAL